MKNIIEYYTQRIFPTTVIFKDLINDDDLNKKIAQRILEGQKTDLQALPTYRYLIDHIEALMRGMHEVREINGNVKVVKMWASILKPGENKQLGIQENSMWTGVYNVSCPAGSGNLFFDDPRPAAKVVRPNFFRKDIATHEVTRQPFYGAPGMCFIFPSWLLHGEETNKSDKNKINIYFNVEQS